MTAEPPLDLDALAALCAKATPGPWQTYTRRFFDKLDNRFPVVSGVETIDGESILEIDSDRYPRHAEPDRPNDDAYKDAAVRMSWGDAHAAWQTSMEQAEGAYDAQFIAALSPDVVLALLDHIDAQAARLAAAGRVVDAARTCVDSMRGAYGGGTLDDLELVLSAYDASHGDVAT